nr:MAG TPA: hypothetical protein [Crassvirales sp.]
MSFHTKNSIALKQKELRSFCLIHSIKPCLNSLTLYFLLFYFFTLPLLP